MQKWERFAVALILNLALSAVLTFYATGLRIYGLAEGGGTYNSGYLTAVGWVIAFLMTLYTLWKRSTVWFVLTVIAGWILPVVFFFNPILYYR